MLNKNLKFLKSNIPELYEIYDNYQPENAYFSMFDEQGDIVYKGSRLYNSDVHELCEQQVELFNKNPFYIDFRCQTPKTCNFPHQELVKNLNNYSLDTRDSKDDSLDCLIIFGIGLGVHIEKLLQKSHIGLMIIYEPDPDVLFAFLNYCNLNLLFNKAKEKSCSCFIVDGSEPLNQSIQMVLETKGYSYFGRVYAFRHYQTEKIDKEYTTLKTSLRKLADGWGFFEDEVISIEHTGINCRNKVPICTKASISEISLPVILIANGPSVDKAWSYIEQWRDKAIIVSCGSVLSALLRKKIIPDIHIEMERTSRCFDIYKNDEFKASLSKIGFIGLNTVCSEFYQNFAWGLMFPKANDAGTELLKLHFKNINIDELYHCNPTVTNMALASLIRLGFKSFYMVGFDYGFRDDDYHHSKYSDYYNAASYLSKCSYRANSSIEGNFSDKIQTTYILNRSRLELEKCIELHADCNYINGSDGARISGTQAVSIERFNKKLTGNSIVKRQSIREKLIKSIILNFDNNIVVTNSRCFLGLLEKQLETFEQLESSIEFKSRSKRALFNTFEQQMSLISALSKESEKNLTKQLWAGSLKYIHTNVIYNHNRLNSPRNHNEYFLHLNKEISNYFKKCFSLYNLTLKELR